MNRPYIKIVFIFGITSRSSKSVILPYITDIKDLGVLFVQINAKALGKFLKSHFSLEECFKTN